MKNKKIIYSILVIILIIVGIISVNLRKIKYTKEFTYLPQYKNMKVDKYEPTKEEQFGNAVYKVENEDYDTYLKKYEKVLKKDGWKINKDEKPSTIEAEKGKHIVKINVVDSKESLIVLIWTK